MRQAFMALDAISVDSWLAADTTWPQVAFPDFSTWSFQAQLLSPAIQSTIVVPVVSDDERSEYETYVSDSAAALGLQSTAIKTNIYEIVQGTSIVAPGPGPYDPIRQIYPVVQECINYNLVSNMYTAEELQESKKTSSAIVGQILDDTEDSAALTKMLLPTKDDVSTPYGILVYPIRQSLGEDGASGKAVGSIVALISWASFFSFSKDPLAVVLRNSCDQVASWKIDQSSVEFLGYKDAHDPKFSSYRHSYDLEELELDRHTVARIPLTVNDDAASLCQYQLDVYPSSGGESNPMNAMLFVGIALGFCVWTVVVFLVYDYILERRNKETLTSALEARAIISSLFPATVRDRLFETKRVQRKQKKKKLKKLKKKMKQLRRNRKKKDQEDTKQESPPTPEVAQSAPLSPRTVQSLLESVPTLGTSMRNLEAATKSKGQNLVMHPKHQLKNFLANTSSAFEISEEFSLNKPIADLFPHTTVLFADIVGFTAWSSERAPEDVFVLLQTIYHAFDKIAKRRGVFKVETIGDCYVAVTGLPDPQPDHAVRMTKFARECMTKMTEVTKKLEVSLGPDTGDLCLRLGLNSGPVTAGVLQGEKSRFQLFGDTVNTASRMESTGDMNRVHLSKSTADLLIEAGKAYWVKARTDLVHAKGKGNVQTFWLVTRADNFSSVAATRSTDELDAELKRSAPSRSRSTFAKGEPIRGVKRTTSDSVTKIDKLSDMVTQGREGNDMREERLVQWQLELFTRLLKKIVASRDDSPEKQKSASNFGWEGVSRGSHTLTRTHSFEMSLNGYSEHTTASQALPVVDRFSIQDAGGITAGRMPTRESSFRIPQRRQSVRTAASFDVSISTFHSSAADFSLNDNDNNNDDDVDKIVVDEVAEIITLPKFTNKSIKALDKAHTVVLEEEVVSQMKDYITTIASMYRKNPFHNFEHAR
jgi:class 3 adenylate cyclase